MNGVLSLDYIKNYKHNSTYIVCTVTEIQDRWKIRGLMGKDP